MGQGKSTNINQELTHKRNLHTARIDYARQVEKEKMEHLQKIAQGVSVRDFATNDGGKGRKQNELPYLPKDRETRQIASDAKRIASGSRAAMPFHVARAAMHAREALDDYRSKWWIVGFVLAVFKDTIGDISYFFGLLAQIFLFIFLFGGGFLRKQIGKQVLKRLIIPIIISFIPVLNIIVPDAVIQVYVRWHISKKQFHEAQDTLAAMNDEEGA